MFDYFFHDILEESELRFLSPLQLLLLWLSCFVVVYFNLRGRVLCTDHCPPPSAALLLISSSTHSCSAVEFEFSPLPLRPPWLWREICSDFSPVFLWSLSSSAPPTVNPSAATTHSQVYIQDEEKDLIKPGFTTRRLSAGCRLCPWSWNGEWWKALH